MNHPVFQPTNSSDNKPLRGKWVLVTGAARRIGKVLALTAAKAGANVIIHYGTSEEEAEKTRQEISAYDVEARLLQSDLNHSSQLNEIIPKAAANGPLYALVNSAAIYEPLTLPEVSLNQWQHHLNVNLTAPFFLSQAFASLLPEGSQGRIVNLLDFRGIKPVADHLPYTITKAALASMTECLALALAPSILVNGLALGAILPPEGSMTSEQNARIIARVPARRWATLEELGQALLFLLTGPEYITGQILYLDGGRHLV
ncbi:MAG: SDR family oxidoreductase [Chloroflexi bacterium]|nr:SDR family oxidoreductase [Chloroflexota bacterium]